MGKAAMVLSFGYGYVEIHFSEAESLYISAVTSYVLPF
jgi:hypothetical protein